MATTRDGAPAHDRPTRRAIPPYVRIVLALAVVAACFGLFVDRRPLDLDVYRTAGRAVWNGIDLYGPHVRIRQYGFTYPPIAAALFALPAQLPFAVDLILMTLASLACLRSIIRLSAPELLTRLRTPVTASALAAVAGLIVCEPVRATLWDGQINLVLVAMVMHDLLRPAGRWRGLLVGLATAIKLTPGVFVLYLLVRRRFADAGRAVAGFAAATALGWALLPQNSATFWLHKLYSSSGIGDESRSSNLYGAFLRAAGRTTATTLWVACAVPVLVIGLVLAVRVADSGRAAFALGIVGVTGCLVSPVTWTHHWVWCVPWLVGVGAAALARGTLGRMWVGVLAVVFVGLNLVPPSVTVRSPVPHFLSANALTLAALLTGLGAALVARRPALRADPVPARR